MRRMLYVLVALALAAVVLPTLAEAQTTRPTSGLRPAVESVRQIAATHPVVRHARRSLLQPVAAAARVSVRQLRGEWQHVAICEVGGNWSMNGPSYSGIGFANSTWVQYGGSRYAPRAGYAPRDVQILIGMRVTGGWVPDQNGCSPGGW